MEINEMKYQYAISKKTANIEGKEYKVLSILSIELQSSLMKGERDDYERRYSPLKQCFEISIKISLSELDVLSIQFKLPFLYTIIIHLFTVGYFQLLSYR